jgi:hypothetical protein
MAKNPTHTPILKSSNFDIHPTPTQKYKKEIKPYPFNNIIDPKLTHNWVETNGKPVDSTYYLTSSQLHTPIHIDYFISSFSDIQKHSCIHSDKFGR